SERDYLPAMEVLADFIRQTGMEQPGEGTPAVTGRPRRETAAAVSVIARRTTDQMDLQVRQTIACIDLSGVNLTGLTLSEGATFDAVCLNDADLSGSVLPGATFTGSDLAGARFWSSRLEGAEFVDTEMRGIDLEASDLTGAGFVNVVLSEANLQGANLVETSMQNSQLLGATLAGARLFGATFPNSDLTAVDLTGALFTGSDLSTALGVSAEQLDLAELDSATLLPNGVPATPDF
ncbi:MAG TPA: pentapeptide repeat-containing protein, partial [Thermomicrobiales bacterium]|nr:pentapeptide repeat-containing protein [Thermomicrobiales bacterium]